MMRFPRAALVAGLASVFVMATARADDFKAADSNHDGKVTLREAQSTYPLLGKRMFDRVDEDHDGWLDEGELSTLDGLSGAVGGQGGRH